MAVARRPLVGLLYSSAAPEVLDAGPGMVELYDVIPERLFYDCGPGHGNRFHWVEGALARLESYVDGTTVAAHGIGLSLPSDMPLDEELLDVIAGTHDRLGFAWYSEHLSSFATMRGAVPNAQAGLGLPVPYDEPVLRLVADKVDRLQDRLGVRVLLENPAVFTPVPGCEYSEPEFLNELARRVGAGVLLDLHNLYVNERNGGEACRSYLDHLDLSNVVEVHLAGGSDLFGFYTDSHAELTPGAVWDLAYEYLPRLPALRSVVFEFHESAIGRIGVPAIVEELGRIRRLVDTAVPVGAPA